MKSSQCSSDEHHQRISHVYRVYSFRRQAQCYSLQRGIQTFETSARNTLDLSCTPMIKQEPYSLIIKYPSHETVQWNLAADMVLGFIACGVEPLMIELRPDSFNAYSDNLSLSN